MNAVSISARSSFIVFMHERRRTKPLKTACLSRRSGSPGWSRLGMLFDTGRIPCDTYPTFQVPSALSKSSGNLDQQELLDLCISDRSVYALRS